jgi:exportin-2 (importin alpha re-exporter)
MIIKGSKEIIQAGQLQSFLGVYQKLLSSKFNDHYAFELLKSIFEFIPLQQLQPFMKNCFVLAFTRLFQHKTTKLLQSFLDFMVHSFNIMNPEIIITEINSIQQE